MKTKKIFQKISHLFSAAPPEVQQIPHGEQAFAGPAGEERDAGLPGRERQRGQLAVHNAVLQAQERRRQRSGRRQGHPGACQRGSSGFARGRQLRAQRQSGMQGGQRSQRRHLLEGHALHGAQGEPGGDSQGW